VKDPAAVPLRLLLDQGLPADAVSLFRELGYECWHVSEFGMQRAEDEDILSFAREHGCVVATLDADFHALVAVRGLLGPSVIRLRREGCRAQTVVRLLEGVLRSHRAELAEGALVSVKEHRTTCHRLPVGYR
jgi:predicted nuclease of predicted toxin-antitoxin system